MKGIGPDGTNPWKTNKVFVDGFAVGGAAAAFWAGGGAGGAASIDYFGAQFEGIGASISGRTLTRAGLMDAGMYFSTSTSLKYVSGTAFAKAYPEVNGAVTSAGSGFGSPGGVIEVNEQSINQEAVDAQSGGVFSMSNARNWADYLNEYNPIASLMDVVSHAFTGADRFGNPMSQGEAWWKAAGVVPIVKLETTTANSLSHIFRDAVGHVNPTTVESQMRYMNLFSTVASDATNLVPTINKAAAAAGVQTFNKTYRAGTVWVQTYNGQIRNAGINYIVR